MVIAVVQCPEIAEREIQNDLSDAVTDEIWVGRVYCVCVSRGNQMQRRRRRRDLI